jgi:hypothetical protein
VSLTIAVEDMGVGIPEDKIEKVRPSPARPLLFFLFSLLHKCPNKSDSKQAKTP